MECPRQTNHGLQVVLDLSCAQPQYTGEPQWLISSGPPQKANSPEPFQAPCTDKGQFLPPSERGRVPAIAELASNVEKPIRNKADDAGCWKAGICGRTDAFYAEPVEEQGHTSRLVGMTSSRVVQKICSGDSGPRSSAAPGSGPFGCDAMPRTQHMLGREAPSSTKAVPLNEAADKGTGSTEQPIADLAPVDLASQTGVKLFP